MKNYLITILLIFSSFLFYNPNFYAQTGFVPADIDAVGDRSWRRQGSMTGNLLGTVYFNTGQVSKDKVFPQLEWPLGSGHIYMDTVVPWVAAEANDIQGDLIHPLETNYEFSLDVSPDGLTEWGWQPLPGYLNPFQDAPAISNKTVTWPEVWPDRPDWAGFWNGFFGRGILNADQETYYVVDDDADEEFEYFPDSTDQNRRGLGMRMSVRGLQWSQVLAEDCIFWIFDVTNVGTSDYDDVLFGMFIDSKNGGHDFDNGFYDTFIDLTYIYDQTGIGSWGGPTGEIGYGFLESPGIGDDGLDNDQDALTDETRDSGPGEFLFGPIGIYGSPIMHWSGDEDGDWNSETDDVGQDGVGPLNDNYSGPDEGEGDGIPTDGEPNFDRTDLDESDQIGLSDVSLHQWAEFPMHEDDLIWQAMTDSILDPVQNFSNIGVLYSSGPFPLAATRTERFSIALLMGADRDDLFRNKDIVQRIFDANYRFARPPDKPTVKAVAGDGFVKLSWDNKAEFSRDPFLGIDPDSIGFKKDFEGYVIYKSTDPGLLDSRLITDAFGNKIFRQSEAQFDVKNGIKGTSQIGLPGSGAHFYLGDDTGLSHTWTDTDVINGQTYYYAVVSYDAGDPSIGSDGLPPSQSGSVIERDFFGNLSTDINTVEITPGVPSAGYRPAEYESSPEHIGGPGSGSVAVSLLQPDEFEANQRYRIMFHDTLTFSDSSYSRYTTGYSVMNETASTLVVDKSPYLSSEDMFPFFDGLGVQVFNSEVMYLAEESGLKEGQSDYLLNVQPDTISNLSGLYPADYEIRFFDQNVATSRGSELGLPELDVNFRVENVTEGEEVDFLFYDNDSDGMVSSGDDVVALLADSTGQLITDYRTTWRVGFRSPAGVGVAPQGGDIFQVIVSKPFREGDAYEFETFAAARVDAALAKSDLDRIKVVPNPYIVTNPLEPRTQLSSGRGERVVQFIHLPSTCTIRIFNIRGQLVDIVEHQSTIDGGSAEWNLVSREGIDVAFGVYIFHVESDVGNKIGRFALIK